MIFMHRHLGPACHEVKSDHLGPHLWTSPTDEPKPLCPNSERRKLRRVTTPTYASLSPGSRLNIACRIDHML